MREINQQSGALTEVNSHLRGRTKLRHFQTYIDIQSLPTLCIHFCKKQSELERKAKDTHNIKIRQKLTKH